MKFFSNSRSSGYLRGLAREFGDSTNSVRIELNRMSEANLIISRLDGRRRVYQANTDHPLYYELASVTQKYLGLDRVQQIVERLGSVKLAIITGDYAKGIDSGIIDLVVVGTIDENYLKSLVEKSEKVINRKIRTLSVTQEEYESLHPKFVREKNLVLWEA